jgi:hypothetical protein
MHYSIRHSRSWALSVLSKVISVGAYSSSRWFAAHTIGHHIHAYTQKRFLSKELIHSPDPNAKFYVPAIYFPGIIAWFLGAHWTISLLMMTTGGLALLAADEIHTGMHLHESWLQRFWLFRELQRLHRFHHEGTFRTNYGVYDFSFDIVFGTMRFV